MPWAILVILMPLGFSSLEIYMAVASPSTSGSVAMMTSRILPSHILCRSSFILISSGPMPSMGGYDAVQHMIDAVELPDPFHSDHVLGVFHDAYDAVVAFCAAAYAAGICFSNVAAYGTVARFQFCFPDRVCQRLRFLGGQIEYMECGPLGRFMAYSGSFSSSSINLAIGGE